MTKKNIIVGSLLSIFLFSCQEKPDLYQSIKDINELQLMEFSLTKTVTIRDRYDEDLEDESNNWISSITKVINAAEKKLKKGNRVGVYGISRDYEVTLDISQLTPNDIVINNNNISLLIPDVEIRSLGDNLKPIVYHERFSAWRSDIGLEERERMMRKASKILDKEFQESSDSLYAEIKKQARLKAESWFKSILKDWGYNHIEINIK